VTNPTRPQPRPAADYTRDELAALLREGARIHGTPTDQAAVRLLNELDMVGTPPFAAHVTIQLTRDPDTGHMTVTALVTDWTALLEDRELPLTSPELTLLTLAGSYATGTPVSLRDCTLEVSISYSCCLADAVLIATGVDRFLHVTARTPVPSSLSYGGAL
jgi:hypothetical protein